MRKNDGAHYIGPKNNTGDLRQLMHYLRAIYKYRTMKSAEFKSGKLSSDFYFGLDKGWSVIAQMKSHPHWTVDQRNVLKGQDVPKSLVGIQQALKNGFVVEKTYEEYKKEYKDIIKSLKAFFE